MDHPVSGRRNASGINSFCLRQSTKFVDRDANPRFVWLRQSVGNGVLPQRTFCFSEIVISAKARNYDSKIF